ncbi:MAG TPA: SRPBCC family protein [Kofleriaceae bacterium]|nr:SRPBCC family protein [Kofleriaceae bacterium]
MPEVEYATSMTLPPGVVWDFIKDMNHWAPFVTGYQKHEIIDDTDSVWTLRGDVGILSRRVELRAHITEWVDRRRVAFTLTGLNEKVDGGGELLMEEVAADAPPPPPPRRRWFGRRFLDWMFRRMFRRIHGEGPKRLAPAPDAAPTCRLRFTLRMDAGGPTGPLVNAMLGPAMMPAAEALANSIAAHLEREHLGAQAAA